MLNETTLAAKGDDQMRKATDMTQRTLGAHAAIVGIFLVTAMSRAAAGPVDIVLNPSPQAFGNTCQSYSMALAMSFHPSSPYQATTPKELRDLELQLRSEVTKSAVANNRSPNDPSHDDWRAAMKAVSGDKLKLSKSTFKNLNDAMIFVGDKTGVTAPSKLGTTLSVQLVKSPVLMSFHKIEGSDYRGSLGTGSHIVTVFGVELPPATMADTAKPKLLLVNSGVKFPSGEKNVCEATDLPGDKTYSAIVSLTDKYDRKLYGNEFWIYYIENK